jgi:hypothetical protein
MSGPGEGPQGAYGPGWSNAPGHDPHDDATYGSLRVRAKRGAELLVAEVKGVTSSPGTDVDTGYGQILRFMSRYPDATQYALVGPERLRGAMIRVSPEVRRVLRLDLYVVDDLRGVQQVDDPT